MDILVTGGNGFIGSHVTKQLTSAGHSVTSFDKRPISPLLESIQGEFEHVQGDITNPVSIFQAVRNSEPDRIIHLVSLLGRESQAEPQRAYTVNVMGTIYTLEAAVTFGIDRVIGASSAASYGVIPSEYTTLNESVPQQPRSIYGLCKYNLERLGMTYATQHDIEFAAIQPFHGFGPDRNRGNVEDAFLLKAAVSDTPYTVTDWERPMELIAVQDEADAFIRAVLTDELSHNRYLIGSGESTTLSDIRNMISESKPNAPIEVEKPANFDDSPALPPSDTSRIEDDLGWEATYSIQEMVEEYLAWLKENPKSWVYPPDESLIE